MAKEGTLLIVDDNRSILAALRLLLEKYFARVLTLPTPNRLATTLRRAISRGQRGAAARSDNDPADSL